MADFQMAKVKVEVKDFDSPGYPIPGCVKPGRRYSGDQYGVGIIPKFAADLALAASYTDAIRKVYISLEGEEDVENEGDGGQDASIRLWYSVLEIQSTAQECREEQLPEPSWNAEVHSSILSLALKPKWKSRGV
jgi:hypothetical protein